MFKIISHIFHFFGIGCFYIAEIKIITSFDRTKGIINGIRKDTVKGYSFSKNPIKTVKRIYEDVPSILIRSMEITKIW